MTGITKQHVESVFVHLTSGDSAKFFSYVSDNISWTVTGSSHPLAQLWNSKQAFIDGSWKRVGGIMQKPMQLEIIGVMIEQSDENAKGLAGRALVELAGKGGVLKSGKEYNNEYCWVVGFNEEGRIVSVRAYLDSAKLRDALEENE